MKKITLSLVALALSAISFAAPLNGAYTVGVDASNDYQSLKAACDAINAEQITGDVTLLITSDLTEPANMGVQNPSEYTLTITVDKAEDRKITFTQTTDNAGPSGNLCIGCDATITHTCASVLTQNVILDGSCEGEGQYLTLESAKGCHKLNGPVLVYGNVKNTTIKNCKLIVKNGAGSSIYPITVRSQKNTNNAPSNILIDGNYLEALSGASDQGLYFQLTTSGNTPASDVTVSNNIIKATTRGIFVNGLKNGTFIGNTISVHQEGNMLSYGIWGYASMSGTFVVENNKIVELTTGALNGTNGIVGIAVGSGSDWVIRNNYISGFNVYSTEADTIKISGIEGNSYANSAVIEHNTIVLPDQANGLLRPNVNMIRANGAEVRNNLLVSLEKDFANALIHNPSSKMSNNVYCTVAKVGSSETTKVFSDYQMEVEATAKMVETVSFKDLAAGDLDLVAPSDGDLNLAVPALDSVTEDIYGTTRGEKTYAGAYEGGDFNEGPTTYIENVELAPQTQKIIRDGQVLIIRDGKTYNMMGQEIR